MLAVACRIGFPSAVGNRLAPVVTDAGFEDPIAEKNGVPVGISSRLPTSPGFSHTAVGVYPHRVGLPLRRKYLRRKQESIGWVMLSSKSLAPSSRRAGCGEDGRERSAWLNGVKINCRYSGRAFLHSPAMQCNGDK